MFSTFSRTRVAGALIGAAIAVTVVGPGSAAGQDFRSPDAIDAATQLDARGVTTYPDVRTPDARDSGQEASPSEDRRSPDARDLPAPRYGSPAVAGDPSSPGGFDLVSAAIGAAAGTGLLIVLMAFLGTGGLAGGRRHGTQRA